MRRNLMATVQMNVNQLMKDYIPDEDIMRETDDEVYWLQKAMEDLSPADRVIFLLYCETGSLRMVGKMLGVSHSIIYKNIKRIKRHMYAYISKNARLDSDSRLFNRPLWGCGDDEKRDMELDIWEKEGVSKF